MSIQVSEGVSRRNFGVRTNGLGTLQRASTMALVLLSAIPMPKMSRNGKAYNRRCQSWYSKVCVYTYREKGPQAASEKAIDPTSGSLL